MRHRKERATNFADMLDGCSFLGSESMTYQIGWGQSRRQASGKEKFWPWGLSGTHREESSNASTPTAREGKPSVGTQSQVRSFLVERFER